MPPGTFPLVFKFMTNQSESDPPGAVLGVFEAVLDGLALVCKILTGVGLVTLTLIFSWLVFGRYVLNDTPTWVEQASLLLVMLITFLGASVGIHESTHLGVSYFRDLVSPRVRTVFVVITDVVMAGFGLLMAWYGYQLVLFKWGSLIPLLGVPEGMRAIPLAIAGGLIFLFSVGHLIRLARGADLRGSLDE